MNPLVNLLAHFGIQGPDGAHQFYGFRNDIGTQAAMNAANGHNAGVFRDLQVSADNSLQGVNDLCGDNHTVDTHPGRSAVRLFTVHCDFEIIHAGIARPGRPANFPGILYCTDMQGKSSVNFWVFQCSLSHHQLRSTAFPLWRTFLGWLEQELDGPGHFFLHLRENFGYTQQHGNVRIVATGMHHGHFFAVVFTDCHGFERQIIALRYRQSVHIRPKQHNGAGFTAFQNADDSGMGYTSLHLHAQRLEVVGHDLCGTKFPVGQFRILVEIAPPCDNLPRQVIAQAADGFHR